MLLDFASKEHAKRLAAWLNRAISQETGRPAHAWYVVQKGRLYRGEKKERRKHDRYGSNDGPRGRRPVRRKAKYGLQADPGLE